MNADRLGWVLIGECTSDNGVHVHRNANSMCAPALPYTAACLTVVARPPERRRRSGAFGRRWERPPRPRAWYGRGPGVFSHAGPRPSGVAPPQISLAGRPLSAAEGAADQSIAPASRVSLAGGSSHLDGGPAQAPSRHSANSAATISSDIVARRMVKRASTRVYSRAAVRCAVILPMSLARLTLPSYSSAWRLSTLSVRAVLTSSPVAAATDSSMRLMAFRASSTALLKPPRSTASRARRISARLDLWSCPAFVDG